MATAPAHVSTPTEARAIAKDAYIYGFPLVDNYRIQYLYFADRNSPEFKTSWNQIYNNARVYTPDDKTIQTPNSDTPYSYVGADLRAEPIVITVPAIENGPVLFAAVHRSIHVQLRVRRQSRDRKRGRHVPAGRASMEGREAGRHHVC